MGDAAVVGDAGSRDAGHDAGNRDGSAAPDAAPDAGPPVVSTGACGCRVSTSSRSPLSLVGLGLLVTALVWRRRRRAA
jgi:MYXO-CTERM domain-containing protein